MKLSDITSGAPKAGKGEKTAFAVRMIHYKKLIPSEENRYSMNEIEELANMIELAGGVKQNLLAKKIAPEEYELISGHRRRAAVEYLVEKKGLRQYEMVPVHLESAGSAADRLMMYLSNAGQRKKSDYDRMIELEGVTGALWELQAGTEDDRKKFCEFCEVEVPEKIGGRAFREVVARKLGLSVTKYANLAHISKNLSPELKARFESGEIGISTANVAAALSPEGQEQLAKEKTISLEDARKVKEEEQRKQEEQEEEQSPGQMSIEDYLDSPEEAEGEEKGNAVKIEGHAKAPEAEMERNQLEPDQPRKEASHHIRIGTEEYRKIVRAEKLYKLLKNDQDFRLGDVVGMMRFQDGRNTGKVIWCRITYIEEDVNGLDEKYCIIGFQILRYDPE